MSLLAWAASLALWAAGGEDALSGLPRSLSQEEQPQPRPEAPAAPQAGGAGHPDLGPIQANAHLGFLFFSKDFEADPELVGGIGARAALPSVSRDWFGFDYDAIGAWLDVSISSLQRDIDTLDEDKGTLFFATLGGDFTFHEDADAFVRGQLGVQYGHFGGVDDTDSGVALLLGASGGLQVGEKMWITLNPQVAFGHGDQVYFVHLGFQVEF
jgi:hypothetical protein